MKKRRIVAPKKLHSAMGGREYDALVDGLIAKAAPPDCILVSVQSVVDDMYFPDSAGDLSAAETVTKGTLSGATFCMPPFRYMWLEYTLGPRSAIQIERIDNGPIVRCALWLDLNGSLALALMADAHLDDDGACSGVREMPVVPLAASRLSTETVICLAIALQSLARMNCKNVEIQAVSQVKVKSPNRSGAQPVIASVWHEIRVKSVPKIRTAGLASEPSGEPRDIRSHWIRGHYADYRKGSGLFGNPKLRAVFWIPEYKKGDEALGQVVPEYKLQ